MFMPIRKKVITKYTKPSEIKKSHAFSDIQIAKYLYRDHVQTMLEGLKVKCDRRA